MLWVPVWRSEGSVQWVACTSVPLHCTGAWVSLMTPFASPEDNPQPPTVQYRLAGTRVAPTGALQVGETEAALACPQECTAKPLFSG